MTDIDAVVAANVRARLAWRQVTGLQAARALGLSQQSMSNKLRGITPFSFQQLVGLAELVGLDDPGPFYRVPVTFPEPVSEAAESAWTRIYGVLATAA